MSTSTHLVIARIQADMHDAGVELGDGEKPVAADDRWAVMWPDAGVERAHTLGQVRGRIELILPVHCVGRSQEAARLVASVLSGVLFGIAGARVGDVVVRKPEQLTARPLVRDDDVKPPLFSQAVEWRLVTTPTTT